jgi:uncharacterized membrane protein (DUF106 family)
MGEYVLPASVVILKLLFRLAVGEEISRVSIFRAVLNFPIDLVFLGISFSVIILSYLQLDTVHPWSTKDVLSCFAILIVAAVIVTACSKSSDKLFIDEKDLPAIALFMAAYLISLAAVIFPISYLGKV